MLLFLYIHFFENLAHPEMNCQSSSSDGKNALIRGPIIQGVHLLRPVLFDGPLVNTTLVSNLPTVELKRHGKKAGAISDKGRRNCETAMSFFPVQIAPAY